LRTFAGRTVEISISNWGGTFVVITGDFERARSRFIIVTQPLDGGKTLCEGIVFGPRLENPLARALVEPLTLAVRRFFTHGYLRDETSRLLGTRYNPSRLIAHDREMIDFFNWVVALPQGGPALSPPLAAPGRREDLGAERFAPVTRPTEPTITSTSIHR